MAPADDALCSRRAEGRVALVTGGTRGIGAAICRSLADEGADDASSYITGQIWAVNGGLDM